MVRQFDSGLHLEAQQNESRLVGTVHDRGIITGESFTANTLAAVDELDEDNTRHGDTVWSDIQHNTRIATMKDFFKAFPVDRADEQKMLINPVSQGYIPRLNQAANLRKDKIIYDALRGNSVKKDGTIVALPSAQKIVHGSAGMTKAKLIQARKIFRANESDQHNGEELFMIYDSDMLEDILSDTTLTSADYMAVKMLQDGDISSKWMSFNWIPYERIYDDGSTKYTIAYCKSAAHFGTGFTEGDVCRRKDKKNTMQASMASSHGCTRVEEAKVVEIAFQ
jgi:hypothetical protein